MSYSFGNTPDPASLGSLLNPALDLVGETAQRQPVVRTSRTEQRAEIDPSTRAAVLRRDRYRCVFCGARGPLEMDHIEPWSAGGDESMQNLRALCHDCNETRSNRLRALDQQLTATRNSVACLKCEPGECEGRSDLEVVYCLTCRARAMGIPS
ncbi:MAG: HNH endonuclease [Gordonia polyisoprenivorans]|nr:HNH endonuclease [Gordonia polyisoprenivorans]